MGYKVKLDIFEGPFDLLVYLIENAQMNIYDIQVAQITAQYLEYIDTMKRLDVAVATEFMVLAAELIEIKSKLLIPRISLTGESNLEEDPRTQLVEKILEYKRFKKAASLLNDAQEYASLIYEKPQEDISEYLDQPDEYLKMDLTQFVNAFNAFIHKKHKLTEIKKNYQKVERQRITIEQKIAFIKSFFKDKFTKRVSFSQLINEEPSRQNAVITFASLLEMAKGKFITFEQEYTFGEITVIKQEHKEIPAETTKEVPAYEQ